MIDLDKCIRLPADRTGINGALYVIRFEREHSFPAFDFCDLIQTMLYDDTGSTGHFRLAPKDAHNLTEAFVDTGLSDTSDSPFLFSGPNEVYVAFAVRPEGTALQEELGIISRELDSFCAMLQDARWEQADLPTLYPDIDLRAKPFAMDLPDSMDFRR